MSMQADAVFEGGGVKGIGLVGAVVEAERRGVQWQSLAGTSAGSIVAALLAAGYSGEELRGILLELDWHRFQDGGPWLKIPILGPAYAIFQQQGLFRGRTLRDWLRQLLRAKGVTRFGDLAAPDKVPGSRHSYRLQVIASDLTRGRMLVLPGDIKAYGGNPDALEVAEAVRMSCSIPFFYRPVFFPDRRGSVVVDGGLLSNFPVWLFDVAGEPPWPTFGFKLVEPGAGQARPIKGPISMLAALFATMMEAHDARYIEDRDFVRTIAIPTLGVGTTEFNLSRERAEALFESGRKAAAEFFDSWDFGRYVTAFRQEGGRAVPAAGPLQDAIPPEGGRGRRLRGRGGGTRT